MIDTSDCAPRLGRKYSAALMLLVCLLAFSPLVSAEPLGRLFLSPERRAVLERQRNLDIPKIVHEGFGDARLHLNGIVRRSNGRTTVWVNRQVQHDDEGHTGIVFRPTPGDPGRVLVSIGSETPFDMRIGETIDRTAQEEDEASARLLAQVKPSHVMQPLSPVR